MKRFLCLVLGTGLASAAGPSPGRASDPEWVILEDGVRVGDLDAFVEMGDRLAGGIGVPEDLHLGLELWARAALRGHPGALIRLARELGPGGRLPPDPARAMALWVRAAQAGAPEAKLRVAAAHLSGAGLRRDPGAAIRLLEEASAAGHPESQRRMAWHLEQGELVARNPEAAVDLYRRAARAGHAPAQNDLGAILALRPGSADRQEAWVWFRLAEEGGVTEAGENRAALERRLSRRELRAARRLYDRRSAWLSEPAAR